MKHITNTPNPSAPDAMMNHFYDNTPEAAPRHKQWQSHLKWVAQFTKGPPLPPEGSTKHTTESLRAEGLIGLYKRES